MNSKEVAERLIELYNQGKPTQAEEELYADTVISHEPDERGTTTGKTAVIEKTKTAFAGIEASRRNEAILLGVNQDTFLIRFEMDVTFAGGHDFQGGEYGFYKVADGMVVEEYFYM